MAIEHSSFIYQYSYMLRLLEVIIRLTLEHFKKRIQKLRLVF